MEPTAWAFLSPAAPRVGDLYGASGAARAGEPLAFALDMEQLEREERAFAASVQALVRRPAPEPIGVKFHRPGGRFSMDTRSGRGSSVSGAPGRGSLPFPPSQFTVDESSMESVGLHERANDDDEEEEEEEEEEGDDDMDEEETDEEDVFTAEEDHDEEEGEEQLELDLLDHAQLPPDPSADDGSPTPLDQQPHW